MTIASLGGLAAVGGGAADPAKVAEQKRLVHAAEQFESMFLQEMLKPLKAGQGLDGETEKDSSVGDDTLSSLGTEALASAVAKAGGFGISRQIVVKIGLERDQHASALGKAK